MTPYDIARSYIGTTEGPGPADNTRILEMYASVGYSHIEHDDVAWCAAFVGHCLEQSGIRSTRKLTARSYLEWGIPIDVGDAQSGDIGVIPRGRTSWQGHVFFIDRIEGGWVWGLGGNQDNAVTMKRYPVSKLLGVRRAGQVSPAVTLSVRDVQERLRGLGYHEVGAIDGIMGARTRAAILAFRDDRALPLIPIVDVALTEALRDAPQRSILPKRAQGRPEESRILRAANAQIGLGVFGAASSIAPQIAAAVSEAEQVQGIAGRLITLWGADRWLALSLPWIGAAVFCGVLYHAHKARRARIDDYRSGKTP